MQAHEHRLSPTDVKDSACDTLEKIKNPSPLVVSPQSPGHSASPTSMDTVSNEDDRPGLVTVYEPSDATATVDIIALHGLGAVHPWKREVPQGSKKYTNWLSDAEMLPRQGGCTRIMRFNYESQWLFNAPQQTRSNCGYQLYHAVRDDRLKTGDKQRPVIFIGHSFGGVVVEEAIVTALVEQAFASHECDLAGVTKGIIFIGAPLRGSQISDWGTALAGVAKLAGCSTEDRMLKDLKKYSEVLEDLLHRFSRWMQESHVPVWCFYEERKTRYHGILEALIVDEHSACIDGANKLGLPDDHMKMAKFGGLDSPSYNIVFPKVSEMVQNAARQLQHTIKKPDAVCIIPFPRDKFFVGREHNMSQIEAKFDRPESTDRVALVGLGGIGKSQIAIEYAYRAFEMERRFVFWVHGSSPARFLTSFAAIATELRLPGFDDPRMDKLSMVFRWLSGSGSGDWLLVLDNADDINFNIDQHDDDSEHYDFTAARYLPQRLGGRVVITSRDENAAFGLVGHEDNTMDQLEARKLLKTRITQQRGNDEDRDNLAKELENIPLALTQAAAYISKRQRMTISRYIDLLRSGEKYQSSLLNAEGGDLRRDTQVPNSVIKTWQISFEQIREQNQIATNLLSRMCKFDKQGIPEYLIRHNLDDLDFEDALERLLGFSFVTSEDEGSSFGMHRLVQFATKTWLRGQGHHQRHSDDALHTLAACYPWPHVENWPKCQALESHIESICTNKYASHEGRLKLAGILVKRSQFHGYQGRFALSEDSAKEALSATQELLGREHPMTLSVLYQLSVALFNQGRLKEAEELDERVLGPRTRVLSGDHPDALVSMNSLAATHPVQSRLPEAAETFTKVMDTHTRVLDSEQQDTLTIMHNLAWTYYRQERFGEVEKLGQKGLEIQKQVIGEEHPETLLTMNQLAMVYWRQNRLQEAEGLLVVTLEKRKRALGNQHPDTIVSLQNLALIYLRQKRLREAEELGVQVVGTKKNVLGDEHPSTLLSMANLAVTYRDQRRWDEAISLLSTVLRTVDLRYGVDHFDAIKFDWRIKLRKWRVEHRLNIELDDLWGRKWRPSKECSLESTTDDFRCDLPERAQHGAKRRNSL